MRGRPGLEEFVQDFAAALQVVDARRPVAVNQRSGKAFQPGIGPHSESETVRIVTEEMRGRDPGRYGALAFAVPYPDKPRQRCDLAIGPEPGGQLLIEAKLLRLLGDNGKPNDNMLMHILSPYPAHRSAVTDCLKLSTSGFAEPMAILIFGYDYAEWPLEPAIDAFEAVAGRSARIGARASAPFSGLCHPVHASGAVFAWGLLGSEAPHSPR